MSALTELLDKKLYPECEKNWDNTRLREIVLGVLKPTDHLLDLGAGRGALESMNFKDEVAFMAGVDPDPAVLQNSYLHDARVLSLPEALIPYEDASFDVVVCNNVLEHVDDPTVVFNEVNRVLKPNGVFIAKTPNKRHYFAMIARVTPHRFHQWINKKRGRKEEDTFPTLFRCNTRHDLQSYAAGSGFNVEQFHAWEARPEYLRITAPTYVLGYGYEKLVNTSDAFAGFRSVFVMCARKR